MKGDFDWRWPAALLLAGIVSLMTFSSMRADIVGLFHDDGIYAVTAKSIAAGTGYRIISLPGTPAQTKYPILYPYLLSWIWRAAPTFPANIWLLKSVNAISAFALMLLSYALFRRYTGRSGLEALAYLFLVGTNMLLMSAADFTLSDNLFVVFVIACVLLHDRGAGGRAPYRMWFCAVMASLGFLTRAAGASLIVAGLVWVLAERNRRDAIVYAVIVAGLTMPWLVWRATSATVTNPLLQYYAGYETSALVIVRHHPRLAWQIVAGNVFYLFQSLHASLLLDGSAVLRWLVDALMLLGSWALLRRRATFLLSFLVVYTTAVITYPFAPGRYLIPLLPFVLLTVFDGAFEVRKRAVARARNLLGGIVVAGLVGVPIALLIGLNVAWFRSHNRPSSDGGVRGFGVRLSYGWSGFIETFDWLRNNTAQDEILATSYDPMYYLYTGRRGVRPWFHHPETYFYPVGRAVPDLGDPVSIRGALSELGVRYLVIDPLDGYAEKAAAPRLFERLLAAYPNKPRLVFTSRDLAHRVYDLRPASVAEVQ